MTETPIKTLVCGAAGRMGREVVRAVHEADGLELVAAVDRSHIGTDAGELAGIGPVGVLVTGDLEETIDAAQPRVMIDFTLPESVFVNAQTALAHAVSPVIGTTGLSDHDLNVLGAVAKGRHVGAIVAPNFAIGAVLMMQFAAQAARYMPDVEIIEMHHERKVDSPSGTAMLTSQRIVEARIAANASPVSPPTVLVANAPGARGATVAAHSPVNVHSVRLPGFVASQAVIFGALGQTLTIRHDSMDRRSFMPGVVLAVRKVVDLDGLVVGLENVL